MRYRALVASCTTVNSSRKVVERVSRKPLMEFCTELIIINWLHCSSSRATAAADFWLRLLALLGGMEEDMVAGGGETENKGEEVGEVALLSSAGGKTLEYSRFLPAICGLAVMDGVDVVEGEMW